MRIPSLAFLALPLLLAGVAAAEDTVDNPLYKHYAKFKAGTTTKVDVETKSGDQTTKTSMTTKIVEITKEKVVLETTTTYSMPGVEIPPSTAKQDIDAKMPKPPDVKPPEDAPKPDVKEGEETVEVAGRKIKCKTAET